VTYTLAYYATELITTIKSLIVKAPAALMAQKIIPPQSNPTHGAMTFVIMTPSIMTLSIMTLSIMTLSIMTFRITPFTIMTLNNDTQ
jgi:hypothetical protein